MKQVIKVLFIQTDALKTCNNEIDIGLEVVTRNSLRNIAAETLQINPNVIVLGSNITDDECFHYLQTIRGNELISNIPVIRHSVFSSKTQIAAFMNAGLFYYITGQYDRNLFCAIIKAAYSDYFYKEKLKNMMNEPCISLKMLSHAKFTFCNTYEATVLAGLIGNALPKPHLHTLGLTEIMLNAIEHGICNIGYNNKKTWKIQNIWHLKLAELERAAAHQDRKAYLEIIKHSQYIEIIVSDDGDGFDSSKFLSIDNSRIADPNGRGILLALSSSFENITYSTKGNAVAFTCNLEE